MRLVGRVGHASAPVLRCRSLQISTHPTSKLSLKFARIIMSKDGKQNWSSRGPHTPMYSGRCGPTIEEPPGRGRGNNPSCCPRSRIAARPRFYVRGKNDRRCSMCLCRSAFDRLFLGLPAGLPDLPLTNRVALPASSSLSYRPAAAFGSTGEERLLGESVMGAPIGG